MACMRVFVAVALKPELFEGLRFDFTKPLNQNFALCHRYRCCLSEVWALLAPLAIWPLPCMPITGATMNAASSWATLMYQHRTTSLLRCPWAPTNLVPT